MKITTMDLQFWLDFNCKHLKKNNLFRFRFLCQYFFFCYYSFVIRLAINQKKNLSMIEFCFFRVCFVKIENLFVPKKNI